MVRRQYHFLLGTLVTTVAVMLSVVWDPSSILRAADPPPRAMVDPAVVKALERHWLDGWNKGDLDIIMEPFADDVVFSSPAVPMVTGDPKNHTIKGYRALREYIANSLRRSGSSGNYTLDATFIGTDSVLLLYNCKPGAGKPSCLGSDIMRLNAQGKVVEWRCHYTSTFGQPPAKP